MTLAIAVDQLSVDSRLHEVCLQFPAGRCSHILGQNGAGKSSLMLALAGLLSPDSGSVTVNGVPLSQLSLGQLAGFRGFHHQQETPPFELTVAELIRFYRTGHDHEQALPDLLENAVEIEHLLARKLSHLSGGEQQRVNLARALLQVWPAILGGEALILLDEPLAGLDVRHQYSLMGLSKALAELGNTLIMTSHDIQLSANYADWLCFLKQGRVVSVGPPQEVVAEQTLFDTFDCDFRIHVSEKSVQIFINDPTVA